MLRHTPTRSNIRQKWLWLLLLLPYLILLWPPLYNFDQPELFNMPFFYWFQLLCVPFTAALIIILHRVGVNAD